MLKKQNRLAKITRKKDNLLFTSKIFNVRISDNNEDQTRFAFIISKKIDKRAVGRNRIKRLLRIAVEEAIARISKGKDIVIIAKSDIFEESGKNFSETLNSIFTKAKILK